MTRGYVEFHRALYGPDRGVAFDRDTLMAYATQYVLSGFTARSVDNNLSKLRRVARRYGCEFPALTSPAWADIKDLLRALKKLDPSETSPAKSFGLHNIGAVLDTIGIRSFADYSTAPLALVQLAVRMLVCHAAMLRGVAHRNGLLVGDVEVGPSTDDFGVVFLRVGARYANRKIKLRPARLAMLPAWESRASAGGALLVYIKRMRFGSHTDILFPFIDPSDQSVYHQRPVTDKQFVKQVRQRARQAGFADADVARVTAHSFRAGGATDYAAAGCSSAFIQSQGGWLSAAWLKYNRPAREHAFALARDIKARTESLVASWPA